MKSKFFKNLLWEMWGHPLARGLNAGRQQCSRQPASTSNQLIKPLKYFHIFISSGSFAMYCKRLNAEIQTFRVLKTETKSQNAKKPVLRIRNYSIWILILRARFSRIRIRMLLARSLWIRIRLFTSFQIRILFLFVSWYLRKIFLSEGRNERNKAQ